LRTWRNWWRNRKLLLVHRFLPNRILIWTRGYRSQRGKIRSPLDGKDRINVRHAHSGSFAGGFTAASPGALPSGSPERWRALEIGSRAQATVEIDANLPAFREALASATDEQMMQPWSLKNGEQVVFTMPRVTVLRDMIFNHLIHHRGQLTVYLRLNDIPVPALYGLSADG
jgi:DinB family